VCSLTAPIIGAKRIETKEVFGYYIALLRGHSNHCERKKAVKVLDPDQPGLRFRLVS